MAFSSVNGEVLPVLNREN